MKPFLNHGKDSAPELKVYLNLDNTHNLPATSIWPGVTGDAALERIKQDGFEGVQAAYYVQYRNREILPYCGLNRINKPNEAEAVFAEHVELGDECITLHLGWGMEDEDEVNRLVESVLQASEKFQLPAFIETHRATVTQDMWRTVQITKAFPEVRFNGDFSHYYCGQEMIYGDFEEKLEFMQPIFERVSFIHARIASSGCMQMPIDTIDGRPRAAAGDVDYLPHFKAIWTRVMSAFLKNASAGDQLIFAPELLSSKDNYARSIVLPDGTFGEESDRYQQALLYKEIANECMREAANATKNI